MNNVETSQHVNARSPKRNLWVWYFLILAVLGSIAVVVPLVYNLSLQLKLEDVLAARKLWQANKPENYDLEVMVRENEGETDEYFVKVRRGRVTSIIGKAEGIIQLDETALLALGAGITARPSVPIANLPPHTIDALFDTIEADLKRDATLPGRRNYATASFDSRDGHPHRYVHRRSDTKERVEWIVKLTPREDEKR